MLRPLLLHKLTLNVLMGSVMFCNFVEKFEGRHLRSRRGLCEARAAFITYYLKNYI